MRNGFLLMLVTAGMATAGMATAAEEDRYVERHELPDGRMAVVAEGDLEPRSAGSYSLRIYGARNSEFPTDDFLGGVIRSRDGSVERVDLADINGDQQPEVIVVIRSAGSGNFLSADAFHCDDKRLDVTASVSALAPDADVIEALSAKAASPAPEDNADAAAPEEK